MVAAEDVLFRFVPNWISYSRVLFALIAFSFMVINMVVVIMKGDGEDTRDITEFLTRYNIHWNWWAIAFYISSFVGDLFDGWVARKLNQTSSFGAVMDMVTDRCATMAFLMLLAMEYCLVAVTSTTSASSETKTFTSPFAPLLYAWCCIMLAILDISSHWFQMYASLAVNAGAHHKSKQGNANRHFLVQWFYQYYWFFGYCCVGAEFTYILLYLRLQLLHHPNNYPAATMMILQNPPVTTTMVVETLLYLCLPGCVLKQVVNIAQLGSACYAIADHDARSHNQENNKIK